MAGSEQTEIQLGHRCNNRCVFCVSGQLTELGKAPALDVEDVLEQLRAARASGHERVTLLGGEPTIQPFFLKVVREAVALEFETIVVFSNGSVTGSSKLIDRVVATGGHFEWRFSFQGGTEESHERTTRTPGSFIRLCRSVERARALDQRVTVNLCELETNYEALGALGPLLVPMGVSQVHVDMFHPDDTGEHPPGELEALIPDYAALAAPLRAMVAGFPPGFDLSIGNLPFCVAPDLAPFIHHGGQPTTTVTVDIEGRGALNEGWDKYAHKQQRKLKPERCGGCVFTPICTGVFPDYASAHGLEALRAIDHGELDTLDPEHAWTELRARIEPAEAMALSVQRALSRLRARAPFGELRWLGVDAVGEGADIRFASPSGEGAVFELRARGGAVGGGYRVDVERERASAALRDGLTQVLGALRD